MLGTGKAASTARGPGAGEPDRRQDLFQRHAPALYQQALLTLEDSVLAGRVVRDVIIDSCGPESGFPPDRDGDDTRARLAEVVFRRCAQLTGRSGRAARPARNRPYAGAGHALDSDRLLSAYERAALGLVLHGGLGYVRASVVLGISARDMAALLRAALLRLTVPVQLTGSAQLTAPAVEEVG